MPGAALPVLHDTKAGLVPFSTGTGDEAAPPGPRTVS